MCWTRGGGINFLAGSAIRRVVYARIIGRRVWTCREAQSATNVIRIGGKEGSVRGIFRERSTVS